MSRIYTKACVTGGAGFIGSHLTRALLNRGVAVTVLDNLSVGRAEAVPAGASLIEGSILDERSVSEAVSGCDIVFHLAARVAIRSSFEFAVEDAMINVAGTASVLRAAQLSGVARKVIAASSMAVYADSIDHRAIDETHPTKPLSPYGVSKIATESLTHLICAHAGMQSVALRLYNTYGPGQQWSPYVGVVTIFVNQLLRKERPTVFGDGEQCRDFVHVGDVVSAFIGAMEANVTGETFNVGSGVARSVNAVLESLQRNMGTDIAAKHLEAAPGEPRYSVADISKAQRALGYVPRYEFDSSVGAVINEITKAS